MIDQKQEAERKTYTKPVLTKVELETQQLSVLNTGSGDGDGCITNNDLWFEDGGW